jgi:hypothetical protein
MQGQKKRMQGGTRRRGGEGRGCESCKQKPAEAAAGELVAQSREDADVRKPRWQLRRRLQDGALQRPVCANNSELAPTVVSAKDHLRRAENFSDISR